MIYVITSGGYEDYAIEAVCEGPEGIDIAKLQKEFGGIYPFAYPIANSVEKLKADGYPGKAVTANDGTQHTLYDYHDGFVWWAEQNYELKRLSCTEVWLDKF